MPASAARHGSSGEIISHFNMVRLRVTGTGNLKLTFFSLQDVKSERLADLPMSEITDIQPRKLANFKTQRASLKLGTTGINEYFRINRIVIYSKPIFSEFPG